MKRPQSLHAHVTDLLGSRIAGGQLPPGSLLPNEDRLASQHNVSRTVIREATKTLQALGMVVSGPRVGTLVQPISDWRLLDPRVMGWLAESDAVDLFGPELMAMRAMIEPAAAAAAARRAHEGDILRILAAVEAMANPPSLAEGEAADFAFHQAVLLATGNLLLMQLWPVLHAVLTASFRLSSNLSPLTTESISGHRDVAQAIARHDAEGAHAAMTALLRIAEKEWHATRVTAEFVRIDSARQPGETRNGEAIREVVAAGA